MSTCTTFKVKYKMDTDQNKLFGKEISRKYFVGTASRFPRSRFGLSVVTKKDLLKILSGVLIAIVLITTIVLIVKTPHTFCEYSCSVDKSQILGLDRSLSAITRALTYYDAIVPRLNLDSLFTIRFVADQCKQILNNWKEETSNNDQVNASIYSRLITIVSTCERLLEKSSTYSRENWSKTDYAFSKTLLNSNTWGNWPHYSKARQVDSDLFYNSTIDKPFVENVTDHCINLISNGKCEICNDFKIMIAPGYTNYMLSHQIFYLLIGRIFGCDQRLNEMIKEYGQHSLNHIENMFCSNMYREAVSISQEGYDNRFQDLFMEQIAFGSFLGYTEFISNKSWLEFIIDWQSELGCYYFSGKPKTVNKRRKRSEVLIEDGCGIHKTGVAIMAIISFLRDDICKSVSANGV